MTQNFCIFKHNSLFAHKFKGEQVGKIYTIKLLKFLTICFSCFQRCSIPVSHRKVQKIDVYKSYEMFTEVAN